MQNTTGDLPPDLGSQVAVLLQVALARAQALGEQAISGIGLSGREYGLLALLRDGPKAGQGHLGRVLGIDRTTTMALLAALEGRGLVDRHRDPANRRTYLVALTDTGDQLRERAARLLAECEDAFLAGLDVAERDLLRDLLGRLV